METGGQGGQAELPRRAGPGPRRSGEEGAVMWSTRLR